MSAKGKEPAAQYATFLITQTTYLSTYLGMYIRQVANLVDFHLLRKDAAPTNPRGIPYAPFVDKVEDYITSREDVQSTLRSFQEMISYVDAHATSSSDGKS